MSAILRKYGEAATILFPLIDAGATDFEATPVTHVAGDSQISKDEGAFANTANAFAHEGNGIYSLALSATEMQAARIAVTVVDSATKAWEDQAILIETYGDASGQHEFDLDSPAQTTAAIIDAVWDEDLVAAHNTADTAGKLVQALGEDVANRTNNPTLAALLGVADTPGHDVPSTVADDVWDEAASGHVAAGSFGLGLGKFVVASTEVSGVPSDTANMADQIDHMYRALINEGRATGPTSGQKTYYDKDGVARWKKVVTDGGTEYIEAKAAAP